MNFPQYTIKTKWNTYDTRKRTIIMGIVNVTPDSFSDGGKYTTEEAVIKQVTDFVEAGVDWIDIGGESTRPNATVVEEEEELRRVLPFIRAIRKKFPTLDISIDTYKPNVAKAAVEAGATIINDVWGARLDEAMFEVVKETQVPYILMHNETAPKYVNLLADIVTECKQQIDRAMARGINKEQLIIDPGIGFAKTYEENVAVLNGIASFHALEVPVLLGTSRKSIVGLTLNTPVDQRLEGSLATIAYGVCHGTHIVRVHDVKETVKFMCMLDKVNGKGENNG